MAITLGGCARPDTRVVVVELRRPEIISPLTTTLRVSTLLNRTLTRTQDIPFATRFGVRVPASWLGVLSIEIQALSSARCLLASGTSSGVVLVPEDTTEVLTTLTSLNDLSGAGCRVNVIVTGGGQGQIVSEPDGISCGLQGTACTALFTTAVRLTAMTTERFLGWSGVCRGKGLTCDIDLRGGTSFDVQAAFAPRCDGAFCYADALPERVGTTALRAVHVASDGALWIAGAGGLVVGGQPEALKVLAAPTTADLRAIHSSAPDNLWLVGAAGTALRYDGAALAALPTSVGAELRGVYAADAKTVFLVGAAGTALRYDGAAFQRLTVDGGRGLVAVHGLGAEVWAVAEDGAALRYSGGAFVSVPALVGAAARAVLVRAPTEVWLAGSALVRWDGQAARRSALPPGVPGTLQAATATPSGALWFVGDEGLRVTVVNESLQVYSDANGARALAIPLWSVAATRSALWIVGDSGALINLPL